jgi:hypothetical protein
MYDFNTRILRQEHALAEQECGWQCSLISNKENDEANMSKHERDVDRMEIPRARIKRLQSSFVSAGTSTFEGCFVFTEEVESRLPCLKTIVEFEKPIAYMTIGEEHVILRHAVSVQCPAGILQLTPAVRIILWREIQVVPF